MYKNTLANELSLSEDKMFAIMAFKNLYPKDFSDLQNESGVVKEAFSDKQKFIYASIRSPTAQDRACRRIAQKSSFGRIAK